MFSIPVGDSSSRAKLKAQGISLKIKTKLSEWAQASTGTLLVGYNFLYELFSWLLSSWNTQHCPIEHTPCQDHVDYMPLDCAWSMQLFNGQERHSVFGVRDVE